jgi:hypothetical protein
MPSEHTGPGSITATPLSLAGDATEPKNGFAPVRHDGKFGAKASPSTPPAVQHYQTD